MAVFVENGDYHDGQLLASLTSPAQPRVSRHVASRFGAWTLLEYNRE